MKQASLSAVFGLTPYPERNTTPYMQFMCSTERDEYTVHRASISRKEFAPTTPEVVTITEQGGKVLRLEGADATDFLECMTHTRNMLDLCERAVSTARRGAFVAHHHV